MPIFATAGARIFIGNARDGQSDDFIEADFDGESWIEVKWTENLGNFGDQATEITFDAIGEGRVQKLKGTRNAGNLELVCGVVYDDPGQAALRLAEEDISDYAFRVEFNDAPSGGSPSNRFFIAKVMSVRETLDGANNVVKLNATLGINSNIVRVNAAA